MNEVKNLKNKEMNEEREKNEELKRTKTETNGERNEKIIQNIALIINE